MYKFTIKKAIGENILLKCSNVHANDQDSKVFLYGLSYSVDKHFMTCADCYGLARKKPSGPHIPSFLWYHTIRLVFISSSANTWKKILRTFVNTSTSLLGWKHFDFSWIGKGSYKCFFLYTCIASENQALVLSWW